VELGFDEEVGGFVVEVLQVVGDEVGTVSELRMAPEWFDRVEFGGVRREPFDGEAGEVVAELPHGVAFVHGAVVPDDDDLAAEVFEQVAEEGGDASGIEGAVGEGAEVEIRAVRLSGRGTTRR
jgi:hypothetical protein